MNQLNHLQCCLDPVLRQKVQGHLDSGKGSSIKCFADENEGLMQERDALLILCYTFEEDSFVCQCRPSDAMWIHKAALMLAQVMLEADCLDCHTAMQILTVSKMEWLIHFSKYQHSRKRVMSLDVILFYVPWTSKKTIKQT